MHSPSHRRIARLFASLLLLWTAADVCDYGLCPHHRGRLGSYARTAFRAGETEERPDVAGADDCFCCSHVVDVRTPFRIALTYQVAWTVLGDPHTRPDVPSVPLYHPPLA